MLYSLEKHGKNDVEIIEYGSKIWINQKYLEKKLDIADIADRTQYYSSEFKKMRCENKSGKYQPCRILLNIIWQ